MIDQDWRFDARSHLLNPGQTRPYLDGFAAELVAAGYTRLTVSGYLQSIAHFGEWAQRTRIAFEDIDDDIIARFASHRCRCSGGRRQERVSRKYVARVQRFVRYLGEHGAVKASVDERRLPDLPIIVELREWLLHHRGASIRTVERYQRLITKLLPSLGSDASEYDVKTIRRVICDETRCHAPATAQSVVTALRTYLRFLASKGQCRPGLDKAIPSVANWRLSALPRYLMADDVERVIAACDTSKPHGVRDRAILLLLARLGLRAGDIFAMRIDDIDWREATLRVRGKGRREVRLPLPQDAGDALLAYLVEARPRLNIDRIFLCANAPIRPLATSSGVSDIVRLALQRAGISNSPSRGANLLRHSAATAMLRAGATLDAISTVLRHRSSDTTAHYAKVDITMLQQVAQPWPEGAPC
jgi:site-specific recombinase XerD